MNLPRHAVEKDLPPPPLPAKPKHRCPLCGYRFAVGKVVCSQCGLSGGCEAIGCPHCGYQFPVESTMLSWITRLWRRLRGTGEAAA